MPSSITTSFLGCGAVLTALSPTAGAVLAGIGVLWEVFLSVLASAEA